MRSLHKHHRASIRAIGSLLLAIGMAGSHALAQPAGTEQDYSEVAIKLESRHTCPHCPVYELDIYGDGTSRFIGRDAVRRMGEAGSAIGRDRQIRLLTANGLSTARIRQAWSTPYAAPLAEVQTDIDVLGSRAGSLAAIAALDEMDTYSAQRPQRIELTLRQRGGTLARTVFYTFAGDTSRLAQLMAKIQGLHRDPRDFDPMPAFAADDAALLNWTHLWPWGESMACGGNPGDVHATLYRNGQVVVYSRREQAVRPEEAEALRRRLAPPPYARTLLTLPPAALVRLNALLQRPAVPARGHGGEPAPARADSPDGAEESNWSGAQTQYLVKSAHGISRYRLQAAATVEQAALTPALLAFERQVRKAVPQSGAAARTRCPVSPSVARP